MKKAYFKKNTNKTKLSSEYVISLNNIYNYPFVTITWKVGKTCLIFELRNVF